jgi:SAM-dependent methyltransferase
MSKPSAGEYPLHTDPRELERLALQHDVWGPTTRAFLARLGVRAGMRVLDLGCGPGLVSFDLAKLVGSTGEVVALDESPAWTAQLERTLVERRITNVRVVHSRIQAAMLEAGSFDLIFARWVFSFLPDPVGVGRMLAVALKPGGILALEDYNHEGISIFPDSEGFRAVVRATRALYRSHGGDAFVMGRVHEIFAAAGLEAFLLEPHVMCGGPGSPALRWASAFFPHYSTKMRDLGLLTREEHALFHREWAERERDPQALFFSPIVADAAARKR